MQNKPSFSKDEVNCIVGSFQNSMTKAGLSVTPELESKFERYVISTKHEYENYLLEKVRDGDVLIISINGMLNWDVNLFSPYHHGNRENVERTKDFIERSVNILRLTAGAKAGKLR